MSVAMVRQKVKDGTLEEGVAVVRDLFATFDRVVSRACATRRRGWWTARRS